MTIRELSPDFDEWPDVWMGIEEDRVYGKKLLPYFEAFLPVHEMYLSGTT